MQNMSKYVLLLFRGPYFWHLTKQQTFSICFFVVATFMSQTNPLLMTLLMYSNTSEINLLLKSKLAIVTGLIVLNPGVQTLTYVPRQHMITPSYL